MALCPACSADLPEGARFCPSCGARLQPEGPESTERKVVTTLFADLVDFTQLGERHDPEDVDCALRAYCTLARSIIERFGGVVEKFIGDAVVGLFGVPATREDDAERAVRAALEILERMDEVPRIAGDRLLARAAVNTGSALVRLRVSLSSGEGALVGDAVNTAARLLAAAPPMACVAGEETYKLTRRAIIYAPLTTIDAKGKSRPVRRWLATGAVARRGVDRDTAPGVPMEGREVELALLSGLLDRSVASSTPQIVIITGEAGIGKSRLVREFFRAVDQRPDRLYTWRQGWCPPYGHALAHWALREIVSDHTGITTSDSPKTKEQKLTQTLGDAEADGWLLGHLRPLVGLSSAKSSRDESFAAWTRFLEGFAQTRPSVVVIEDLHWASEATLSFLDYFARQVREVPLLLITTARPELLEDSPAFVQSPTALTRVELKALDHKESGRLAAALAGDAGTPQVTAWVADQCGGNPLFAEELTRYLVERASDNAPPSETDGAVAAAPVSVLALIEARLDALPPQQKGILADASVVGMVFRTEALSAVGDLPRATVDDALARLADREFIRRLGDDTEEGREYAFWHALVRDVAYGQLTRKARAIKHTALAWWLDSAASSRADQSAVTAHHYVMAFDYSSACGLDLLARALAVPAVRHLLVAGDETLALDVTAAERHYARAVELSRIGSRQRAVALAKWGETLMQTGRLQHARSTLLEAIGALRAAGATREAALCMTCLGVLQGLVGEPDGRALCEEARSLIEADGDSEELLTVLIECAGAYTFRMESAEALRLLEDALSMAIRLAVPIPTRALHLRGICRFNLGHPEALADYRQALSLALEQGQGREAAALYHNLAEELLLLEGPDSSLETRTAGLDFAHRRHDDTAVAYLSNGLIADHFWGGRWQAAEAAGAGLSDLLVAQQNRVDLGYFACVTSCLHALRGETAEAGRLAELVSEEEIATFETDPVLSMLPYLATTRLALGDERAARALLVLLLQRSRTEDCSLMIGLPLALRTAVSIGGEPLVRAILDRATTPTPFRDHAAAGGSAVIEEACGDHERAAAGYAAAASRWDGFHVPYESAQAALGQARCLVGLGRQGDANHPLAAAKGVFAALGATPALAEAERLAGGEVTGPRL
jgi:class 3 adenylate cyclase/tetratricopeptide (TPR) repeat protein